MRPRVHFNPEKDIPHLNDKVFFITGGCVSHKAQAVMGITDNWSRHNRTGKADHPHIGEAWPKAHRLHRSQRAKRGNGHLVCERIITASRNDILRMRSYFLRISKQRGQSFP